MATQHPAVLRVAILTSLIATATTAGCAALNPRAHPTTLAVAPISLPSAYVGYNVSEMTSPGLATLKEMFKEASVKEQRRDADPSAVGEIFSSIDQKWREKYGEPNRGMRSVQFEEQFFLVSSYG